MSGIEQGELTLLQHRRLRFLSQGALADLAGVTKKTVVQIEKGRGKPQLRVMKRLSEALGVPATAVIEFRHALLGTTTAA